MGKEKKPNLIGALFIVATLFGVSSLSFLAVETSGLLKAHQDVCRRVESDFVKRSDPTTRRFVEICLEESHQDVLLAKSGNYGSDSRRALIEVLNERLSALRMSHVGAYAPDETAAMWTAESVDTGARGRLVDGEIVITRTVPGSSAERAGLHAGDVVIAVDGIPVQEVSDVQVLSGFWEILRPDETRVNLPVQAEVIRENIQPKWMSSQERNGVRILKIPSFLPQAIENDDWKLIVDELGEMRARGDRLVVDLRGNQGGSFPGMLRVLGAVSCRTDLIGWLYRDDPPAVGSNIGGMQNSIDAEPQLELLELQGAIALSPFKTDSCFDGPLVALIDQGTGSVSEIFAQAIKERPQSFVMGWRSAGHVVMARWFQIAGLSADYTVSIPVALYRSAKGQELEGVGVSPDQILTDELKQWRSRRDPWIEVAVRTLKVDPETEVRRPTKSVSD